MCPHTHTHTSPGLLKGIRKHTSRKKPTRDELQRGLGVMQTGGGGAGKGPEVRKDDPTPIQPPSVDSGYPLRPVWNPPPPPT